MINSFHQHMLNINLVWLAKTEGNADIVNIEGIWCEEQEKKETGTEENALVELEKALR